MEEEYFDADLEPSGTLQEDPLEGTLENDCLPHVDTEYSNYSDDDPWLNEELITDTTPSDCPNVTDDIVDNRITESASLNDQRQSDGVQEQLNNHSRSAISFRGYGRCECGCGSFGGHGNICSYCGHPYSSHSRYKK